ncbi:unnamed protein product [Gongylonema pulchrum]|uniref:Ubiquitin-like domain-containing protein n=1 Tax=Gongylonema pulchrum TaxID=637853 RepID=A0A183DB61_9BILA|nr:unnamed protein product [Gongylonema pulchrum]
MPREPASQDLFFEILRRKTHIFCDAKENATVMELKRIVEGILKLPVGKQILKKQNDEGYWLPLSDEQTLSDCGFSSLNARAQAPASIALVVVNG